MRTISEWKGLGPKRLRKVLEAARRIPSLKRRSSAWNCGLELVGATAMTRLNTRYRGKRYPTDILSFPAPLAFREAGVLGDLVVCVPTLKRQAREMGHSPERELDILLVHGVLHLLGFDHEKSPRAAVEMARWESRLLRSAGLVGRSRAYSANI